ncbi:DUF1476 domain-containing protein [Roseospira navarrensis]|uniref:DUF1476 family protein n=1 Tax=Roseospira navarrensis TaxID=140058 RepID=A0A7X1ZHC6_9PROT|nr:DUF1476 domain-containing protein [Roseospira navarrensis]MQX38268.1 DUF1476 family protein [Roseospira navarrensis]
MSDPFREREKGFEAKFEMDEALRFRIVTRRNKLFGLWVAAEMGLSGSPADQYARALIEHDLTHGSADALTDKALADLTAKGVEVTRHRLDLRLSKLMHEAEASIRDEQVGGVRA